MVSGDIGEGVVEVESVVGDGIVRTCCCCL